MQKRVYRYRRNRIFGQRFSQLQYFSKDVAIWLLLLFLIFLTIVIYQLLLLPQIHLEGEKVITLNYKEKYKEKGYKASFLGEDITKKVQVSGKVDSNHLGKYQIVYRVKVGAFERKVVRKVVVTDNSAPVIEFEKEGNLYVCPGKKVSKEEYRAFDNYDGDLTDQVKVTKKKDQIIYQVSDQHGNQNVVTHKILYEDKTPPQIQLEGGEISYAFIGEEYIDPGYQALDNCDGDLTSKVIVSGEVDTSKSGEQLLTYTVSDSAGNKQEVVRKVIVAEHGKNGTIYLTFDDGPKSGTTNVILDILKEEGVLATFFVTNSGPDELILRAYQEGHSIALHTASHDYSYIYSSVEHYFQDLFIVQERVKRITGYESKIIRFPGGSSNTISRRYSGGIMSTLTKEVLQKGYRYYDWNIDSKDAESGTHTADEIAQNVISSLSKNKVNMVLLHDIKSSTRDALQKIICYGKENGYTFDKITMNTEMITQHVNN